MFTGIIEEKALVTKKTKNALVLTRPENFGNVRIYSSIAVAGVCLSVSALSRESMTFDIIPETLAKTTLGRLAKGDRVNLERALPVSGRFDGHIVQGHVEGMGKVLSTGCSSSPSLGAEGKHPATSTMGHILKLRLPRNLVPSIVPKGSIAIDGVSLTVADIDGDQISIALIPLTIERTTLGWIREGDRVNVETDILGKYVHRLAVHQFPVSV